MATVAADRKLTVQYEDFCGNPRQVFDQLVEKLSIGKDAAGYKGPPSFAQSRAAAVPNRRAIEQAFKAFASA
jgi:hypothetical protein